ncbi:MAG: cell envelope integrity protein CreD [Bacteroidales bacterium]|nr:cell envelope integrity protein CreD [Bacteroidales bacterium]
METKNIPYKPGALKLCIIALISLLLLIPLVMVQGLIHDRSSTKETVEEEIANSTAQSQTIAGPVIFYEEVETKNNKHKETLQCLISNTLNYNSNIETETLHRSIYDVVVYNSKIKIDGTFKVTKKLLNKKWCYLYFSISDLKGLQSIPEIKICDSTYTLELDREDIKEKYNYTRNGSYFEYSTNTLTAKINLPENMIEGQELKYEMTLNIKGTKEQTFEPCSEMTTLTIQSSYPHPSFIGDFLPTKRSVTDTGFSAEWSVLGMNVASNSDGMGVAFVNPSDPYLQSERTSKYGFLIIALVFVAALLAEFISRKEITIVQYAIVGLSLVLFYSLLISFSEITGFGLAYLISAIMTTLALMFYFRRMLKNKAAYFVGGFVGLMYIINYIIIQMETFSLLTGSLLLFIMLLVLMYFTSNMNNISTKDTTEN